MHGLKNWSPPGIEPGSMALNAIALTARPRRLYSGFGRPKFNYPTNQPFNPIVEIYIYIYINSSKKVWKSEFDQLFLPLLVKIDA